MADISNLLSVLSEVDSSQRVTIDQDFSLVWIVEALNELNSCAFTGARRSDDGSCQALLELVREVNHDRRLSTGRVVESHVFELDFTLQIVGLGQWIVLVNLDFPLNESKDETSSCLCDID